MSHKASARGELSFKNKNKIKKRRAKRLLTAHRETDGFLYERLFLPEEQTVRGVAADASEVTDAVQGDGVAMSLNVAEGIRHRLPHREA